MPTIAKKPTLKSTQAVGAILFRQLARERFLEAGLDDRLIKEAEAVEHVDDLTAVLLEDDDHDTSTISNQGDMSRESSHNLDNSGGGGGDNTALYHSVAESSIANGNDTTVYHSMNAGRSTSVADRVTSMPSMASYGREFRRLAEEFERDRLRQTVKSRADQVSFCSCYDRSIQIHLIEFLYWVALFYLLFLCCIDSIA